MDVREVFLRSFTFRSIRFSLVFCTFSQNDPAGSSSDIGEQRMMGRDRLPLRRRRRRGSLGSFSFLFFLLGWFSLHMCRYCTGVFPSRPVLVSRTGPGGLLGLDPLFSFFLLDFHPSTGVFSALSVGVLVLIVITLTGLQAALKHPLALIQDDCENRNQATKPETAIFLVLRRLLSTPR